MERAAVFSPCRTWRYVLRRTWGTAPALVFVGLNPSTADETQDDPTVRRCIGYARSWGYGGLTMLNAYALRSTDPKGLWRVEDPVGPENDRWLHEEAEGAPMVVVGWGANCPLERERDVLRALAGTVHCLTTTQRGRPGHPLYLRADLRPRTFTPA